MSCIAVNLNEVKKEVIRIDLKRPILGKDGPKQRGEFFNVDTGAPVTDLLFKRRGFYSAKAAWIGENLKAINKDPKDAKYVKRFGATVMTETDSCYMTRFEFYVAHDNTMLPLNPFKNIPANSRIDQCYTVYTFLDDGSA